MFYLLYGTDTVKARAKMHEILLGAQKKRPDAEVFSLTSENFSPAALQEFTHGMGLFEKKYIVLLDRISENKALGENLLEALPEMAETENLFLIYEGKLDKKTVGKFEKNAQKVEGFEKIESAKPKFNVFGMADAFGRRDKKSLWVLYQQAQKDNQAPEAISGMLFWKIKQMLGSGQGGKFSESELRSLSSNLVSLYHDSHRGIYDFEVALERFILSL